MTTETLRRFSELYERKSSLEAEVNQIKAEIKGLRDQVMEYFADAGQQSVKLATGRSVYIYHQWRPARLEDVSSEDVARALIAIDHGDLTGANWSTLGSWVRELERDDDDAPILPAGLAAVLEVNQTIEPRSRKAS